MSSKRAKGRTAGRPLSILLFCRVFSRRCGVCSRACIRQRRTPRTSPHRYDLPAIKKPCERQLRGRCIGAPCDRRELAAAQQRALPERRIRHHRHPALAHPRQEIPFDAALAQVIEHLIGRAVPSFGECRERLHVRPIEIGDAPAQDLAAGAQRFERIDGLGKRNAAAPMQQIEIDVIGAQSTQAALAGRNRRFSAGVVRIHLGYYSDLIAPAGDCTRDDFLGAAVAVHLGGVDERHAEVEAERERRNFVRRALAPLAHPPRPLPQCGHLDAIG